MTTMTSHMYIFVKNYVRQPAGQVLRRQINKIFQCDLSHTLKLKILAEFNPLDLNLISYFVFVHTIETDTAMTVVIQPLNLANLVSKIQFELPTFDLFMQYHVHRLISH